MYFKNGAAVVSGAQAAPGYAARINAVPKPPSSVKPAPKPVARPPPTPRTTKTTTTGDTPSPVSPKTCWDNLRGFFTSTTFLLILVLLVVLFLIYCLYNQSKAKPEVVQGTPV